MKNMLFQTFRIFIFVYATEFQKAKCLSVPEPCPDITPSVTIANMCSTDYANEEPSTGSETVDSVALRAMIQQDGCTCEVSLKNQYPEQTIYMRKYDLLTSAAPQQEKCGLAIDIAYTSAETFQEKKASIQCTKGITTRSVSFSQNGIIHLRSRIIDGDFTRGYCIQIYRKHITGDQIGIQINCSLPDLQTTKQDNTVSSTSNMQTTQQMTNAAIQDETVPNKVPTLYIAIGVGSAVVVITLFVVVSIIIIRRKGTRNKNDIEIQPDIDSTDDDSEGLKYNTLYHASEQQEIMEGNYHIVELEGKQNRTGTQNFDSDYSTVDGHYNAIGIVNMPANDGSKTDNGIKSSSSAKPRSETKQTEETSNDLKHMIAGSNVEYAVVDKSHETDQNIKHVNAHHDSNVEYAVVDKKKKRVE